MNGSTTGRILTMTTFGESHGKAIGVVLDGFPAGMELSEEDIQPYLDRRRPGRSRASTARDEADRISILSGVFEGRTTGTPIAMIAENTSQRGKDYDDLRDVYRPSHADYGYEMRYGIRDHRGGGRSSGRETLARVAAGAVCQKLLKASGVDVFAYTRAIGPVRIDDSLLLPGDPGFDRKLVVTGATAMPDRTAEEKALSYIEDLRKKGDSAGGILQVTVTGVPAGVGDPVFHKLDADLAHALMSIGAVKAVEVGEGIASASLTGSGNNDAFIPGDDACPVKKATNRAGGITGGISDGSPVLLRAYVKPTPSVSVKQQTVRRDGTPVELTIKGRHDPVIVPRAAVVAECMCAFVILDHMLARGCVIGDGSL